MTKKADQEIKKNVSLNMLLAGDALLIIMVGILITITYCFSSFILSFTPSHIITNLIVVMVSFYISLCLLALCIPKLKPGTYSLKDPRVKAWFVGFTFARIWNYELIRHPIFAIVSLRIIFLKCMGSKISAATSLSSDASIFDPYLIEIEEGCTIGMGTFIVPHYIARGNLVLSPIKIGKNVLVGAWSTIGPGVVIGDSAALDIGVTVLPNTKIPKDCKIQLHSTIDRTIEMSEGCTISAHTTPLKK